jgi:hypothetical protein
MGRSGGLGRSKRPIFIRSLTAGVPAALTGLLQNSMAISFDEARPQLRHYNSPSFLAVGST